SAGSGRPRRTTSCSPTSPSTAPATGASSPRTPGCSGAGRAAGCGGPTTSGPTSSTASSPTPRSRPSSSSTPSSATGRHQRVVSLHRLVILGHFWRNVLSNAGWGCVWQGGR
ncbi:Os04g0470600, partial [Oryza sativa Japonica Group]